MKKSELLEILNSIGVSPSKRLGQNFMLDGNLLKFIVRQADIHPGDNVLEIGPGCGALTRMILDEGANIAAVEIDKRLCGHIESAFTGTPGFRLIRGDACRLDLEALVDKAFGADGEAPSWKCVANLPYSISSPFIAKLAFFRNPPRKALFLLQRETAMRFAATPGTKNYGALSVTVQLVFNVKYVRTVSPNVFFPVPDVQSALVEFTPSSNATPPEIRESVSNLARTAFSQRRKKMIKAFSVAYGKERCLEAFAKLGLSENVRAEELTPEMFIELAEALSPNPNHAGGPLF